MAGNLTSKKSVSLSLTSQYAPSWKTWEGIRELVQNWHDGVFSSLEKITEKMQLDCRTEMLPRSSVAFLSCKQGESLVYKAVLTTAGNSFLYEGMTELNSSSDNFESVNGEFDRSFESTRDQQQRNAVLGKIVYSPFRKKLILVNYNTELMRKVLLLGFSKKASSKEVIGQFGEGLKVGALALVREGRFVSMETSRDRWKFGLSCDDTFNEEVLTVFVKDRSKGIDDDDNDDDDDGDDDLGQQDTCVTVRPLCLEDWKVYLERFLFLCPPSDCVKSEIGTLLIGDRYKGQLYVKGVWVSDLSKDGLSSGVDFAHLKIDRDRRAVVHLSDIDHQISSMWVHAIEQRPDLIPLYYSLLEENNTSDVRHANFYLTDKSAFLVAQQFFAIHGNMTYPVSNSISTELLDEIKREIHQKLVLCNEALINILYKSGAVEPVESILSRASMKKSVIVPYADLTQDEVSTLKHIEKLVQICILEFKMGSMDISEASGDAILLTDSNHFEIPRGLLREKIEHYGGENCRRGDSCLCREALITAKILTLQPALQPNLNAGKTSSDHSNHNIIRLMASLSTQVCKLNPPFCSSLHEKHSSAEKAVDHSVLRDREMMLLEERDFLKEKLLKKDKTHAQELLKLQSKISSLEKELAGQQVNLVNIEEEMNERWKISIQKLHQQMAELSNTITDLKRDKIFFQEKLTAAKEDASNKQKSHSRQMSVLADKSDVLRRRLAAKFEKLSQIVLASQEVSSESVAEILKSTAKEIEEMWFQKDNCIICTLEKPNCVVIPCRHQITCFKCTSFLETCSYCRGPIYERILTYGL